MQIGSVFRYKIVSKHQRLSVVKPNMGGLVNTQEYLSIYFKIIEPKDKKK